MPIHFTEKQDIETALGMSSGYVLDFSNRTFADFIASSIKINIYGGDYSGNGSSKANHLRCFFEKADDFTTGRLLSDLITYARSRLDNDSYMAWDDNARHKREVERKRLDRCQAIADRLKQAQPVANLDALRPNVDGDNDFAVLADIIREGIQQHKPGPVLDRLHTFCMKYFRAICRQRHITFDANDNLGNLIGKYVKYIENERIIEAEVTLKILRSSISIFGEFNYIRNNKSLAHDNQTLNDQEAMLLFNHVANAIKFVEHVEKKHPATAQAIDALDDDIPF